uniref:C2 domain-containing protein n=1 Tax=Leersia perrieri TaxID=77586 RepID=A0A0D9VFX1_9ORYZ
MFEGHVLYLLRKYLGEYVEGLSVEALRISVWKGDVVLKDLKLKAEALNALRLPVTVKAGFVGTITLKVPWKSLGKEPVIVLIDRLFVLAHPAPDGQTLKEEDREKLFEAKLQQIEAAEAATLEATSRSSKGGPVPGGNSWLYNLISTIIGNLKVTISNVHIRYEDSVSNSGHPFASGFTLSRLAAVTVDEDGNETFDAGVALDKLRKSVELHRLAIYHDSDSNPWKLSKKWEDLNPVEWGEVIFQDGIDDHSASSVWAMNRNYLVSPINGTLNYKRLGKQERGDPDIPLEKASLVLSDVSLTVTEAQYYDGIKLLETFSRFRTRVDVSHLRPIVPVKVDCRAWWRYAVLAAIGSHGRELSICASCVDVMLLAHAKVETVKSKETLHKKGASKRRWWTFGWNSVELPSEENALVEAQLDEEEKLTKEEWQAINKLLTYQQDDDMSSPLEKVSSNTIRFLVDVSIGQAAARIINIDQTEILCGRFEKLQVVTKLYPRSTRCDVTLRYCGLSSPEGSLAQSVISEGKSNALDVSFVHAPVGMDLDWQLVAKISPCHVTVLKGSYERFLEFIKRSKAVSPTVTMETATALQMKIEQVTRRAQEQLQMVLEEQSRFGLDIDLDAPKVRIPLTTDQPLLGNEHFVLDLGHFTLHTRDGTLDEERQSLYSRFYISGRDMAAFLVYDTVEDIYSVPENLGQNALPCPAVDDKQFCSLLDRCGMSVIIDQIKVPHPSYPSTRISFQVPNLDIHFSPKRYCKIVELLGVVCKLKGSDTEESHTHENCNLVPWYPADLAGDARTLGLGYSLAEWHTCYVVLSGMYLYILESEVSQDYQRCCSMASRQVIEVPSTSVGGSLYSIAVCSRGLDMQKALESTSTLIIEFHNEIEKANWMKALVQATYQASAPPEVNIFGDPVSTPEPSTPRLSSLGSVDLLVNGSVIETKVSLYGKLDRKKKDPEELLMLELLGIGGKVNVVQSSRGLSVKTKLHSLKIKDELQGRLSTSSNYLACSVINDNLETIDSSTPDEEGHPKSFSVEEDSFMDALTDFTSDQSSNLHDLEIPDGDQQKLKPAEVFYEAEDNNVNDFVVLTFLTRTPDSCLYDGIDSQMSIRMSALEFYCNRPTLVALIEFGFDVSMVNSVPKNDSDTAPVMHNVRPTGKEDNARNFVKGLLGYGKRRTIFNMKMDVDRVSMFLNKEDGSQLAMFVQEKFLFDLKVHPSSFSIDGMLGNMRFCDMSLGPDHRWGWLCDIRKPGVESLIKFAFQSYSSDDDDYEGYNYSLIGQLSAVRIVFLYRFVQEFTSYFMELATPHTEEAIKFIDKVGGFEWLIQKYEIDGASAIKLDLSLDTPIIIVPKNSQSEDYIQLDLGQLKIRNDFSWHGGEETDPSAVRLDVLHAEINGINMAVGVNGILGKSMIKEGHGINIEVRRSLRDVFKRVPILSMKVQIGLLHAIMSDKEYNVITSCISTNLSESPNLPPSFRENVNRTKDSIRLLADKVNLNNHLLLSRTVVVMTVDVQYALLELRNGPDAESPLAELAVEGLWVSYRTTSLFEMDLYLSILKFSVHDIRPDTKSEMRLMLGSYSETSKLSTQDPSSDVGVSNLTMLILDYRWRSSFQSFVIRIQQPRVLVVLDFLLPVVEFFVPNLGTITGREESLDPKNDPLIKSDDIILCEPIFFQKENFIQLSPGRQLIVDGCNIDDFTYDGCGGTISLCDEYDKKGQLYSGTIIILGRGKKLRFRNVKIENGALLRRCVYLNAGSSYSISAEDGVEVSVLENVLNDNEDDHLQDEEYKRISAPQAAADTPSAQMLNFTFEAQVISPEFTFYDSSKLTIDDSLHIEKLLRAKMDFSFMYASKEKDIWARSVVKDLTIEAGSGLLVLEPVDVSWKYTSVSEKTNIVLASTDVFIHLSLSVASLLLKLQNQTLAALQFGNNNPLVSCTNFKRVWTAPNGELPGYNLTFWRPQAPSNYVILGDCVSSRCVPPSQVVVAVSNTYGRVRRPLGFRLVHVLPGSIEQMNSSQLAKENECSIWIPVPPPGYLALGCVANIGRQPPSNHTVYCLRSDLVTSTAFSDCIHTLSSTPGTISGFSIWRVDNVIASFHAHNSIEEPTRADALDLHHVLLRNPNCYIVKDLNADSSVPSNRPADQLTHRKSTSGWDAVRNFSRPSSYCMSTPHFERIWWDKGGDTKKTYSIWRPLPRFGFSSVGDCITEGFEPPTLGILFKCDNAIVSERPTQFTKVAQIEKKGFDELFLWYPVPPPGYASLGCVATKTDEMPSKDSVCCPKLGLVNQANISEDPMSRSSSSKGPNCWSIWKVENQGCTFLARSDTKKPPAQLAYSIADHAKPKARENITAELKLGCLSVSILDSSCGMVTPLFDTTIANINLATYGRFDTMNAVLICSIAASTFNRHLEAWEPFVEPFDGIFKFETYDTSKHPPSKVGKRIRVAATSPLNVNLSSANIDLLVETLISWRRQIDLEIKSSIRNQDTVENAKKADDLSCSALDEDDFQRIVFENKLGCDIYIKKHEDNEDIIELLQHENQVSLFMPPPRFSDKLSVLTNSTESRYYVVIQIFESKGLPIIDDGNDHSYFCALRLLIGSDVSDQYKVFPQSARTRCVKPVKTCEAQTHHAKWNEHFIFEVPEQASTNLEIEVTNLASKAGKGEVLGSLSIPIGRGATTLKRAASIRIIQQAADIKRVLTCPLTRKGQAINDEDMKQCGMLVLSSCYVERSTQTNFQSWKDSISNAKSGFWIGLSPDGPWECYTAALPLSTIPKSLNNSQFAFEVTMRNGKKHASLRALAVIVNDADIKLEVSVCPVNMLNSSVSNAGSTSSTSIVDEVFENQCYRPISGWGSNPASDKGRDVEQWSTKDFSYSSKAFFEPRLPPGWKWTSPWKIEKSSSVDSDGWAYAANFENLDWPSSWKSSKSPHDFVRRRRWVRSRQPVQEQSAEIPRKIIAVMEPHSSTALPWTTMIKDMDLCLQLRPFPEKSQESYSWSQVLSLGSESLPKQQQSSLSRQNTLKQSSVPSKNSVLRLAELEKKDMLSYCYPPVGIKQYFWLSVGIDASIVHTDLNMPVYDWKICFNSIFRLENKLPYEAEYAIWEKSKEGSMVERQHGIVSSGGSAFIYSADIRKPIYLTMFVQNGWILEKDTVLILDLLSLEHVTSFWMVQKRNQRRLRVSVEHDLGASDAAPKTVRLFVPYWIKNNSSIPLSYRIVEVEPTENSDADSLSRPDSLSRAAKSSKFSLRYSSKSLVRRGSVAQRNMHILEVIEDCSTDHVMLSPQDYINRSAGVRFESRDNNFSPAQVAICVAVGSCKRYSIGVSLFELENKEHVDVKAFASDGSYYWFSAQLKMTSDRTKVVNFLPRALFINRIGRSIILSEYHSEIEEHLHPHNPPKAFQWRSEFGNELLKLRLEGYKWSTPFSIDANGVMCVLMNSITGNDQALVRINVRSGTKSSRYEVIFQLACWSSPYRVENRSMFLPIRFRQVGGDDYSWRSLPPNSSASFFWEDIGRRRLLEVLVDGSDPRTSMTYDIDVVMDHQPLATSSRVKKALCVTVLKEGKFHVTQISDWLPDTRTREQSTERLLSPIYQPSEVDSGQSSPDLDSEFHVTLELTELGLSIIDHMPEEILYLSVQQLSLAYSSGMGSGINRLKMQMHWIQVDNQLPFVLMPVLFCPQKMENQADYVIKFTMTMQTNNSLEFCVYPYLGVQVPENCVFFVNIHEPIIWRLHEMIQHLKFDRISSSQTSAVSVDPILKIGLLNISEIRFIVSMAMSPTQRPRGVLGFWSSLMTALGNMEHMPVRIAQRYREELCMRQSALMSSAISNIQKDILSQPLQLLSGVDILGNASSALSNMSKGIAALSMDKKFIQGRMRQDSKGVEDFGDVIRDGGGALAKGIFRGVTGILTKPIEGAKSSGVEGFVQGVGKGLIGAAAQPVSGVLDLLSKTTEGANAVKMKISSAIMAEEQLLRRRLPRAIGGDSLLYPYDEHKAAGQAILQLAEYATFLGQVDLFKVRGKFASTDAYEDHFMLPKGKILVITHRRVLLLQVPMMTQRKFNPAKDPCSVIWDVLWDDLVTVEMTHGKKDAPGSLPSKLILYLKAKPTNSREVVRLVKCNRGSDQATLIHSSIDRAYQAYGPNSTKELLRWKVPRPYAPRNTSGRTVQDLSFG